MYYGLPGVDFHIALDDGDGRERAFSACPGTPLVAPSASSTFDWSHVSDENFCWLVGLIEAEGSLVCLKEGRRPQCRVEMTDRDVVQRVADLFQTTCMHHTARNPRHKDSYSAVLRGRRLVALLALMYPSFSEHRRSQIRRMMQEYNRAPHVLAMSRAAQIRRAKEERSSTSTRELALRHGLSVRQIEKILQGLSSSPWVCKAGFSPRSSLEQMVATKGWQAGYLEGEGYFWRKEKAGWQVSAQTTDEDVAKLLAAHWGSPCRLRPAAKSGWKDTYVVRRCGDDAIVSLLLLIYPMMGRRRREAIRGMMGTRIETYENRRKSKGQILTLDQARKIREMVGQQKMSQREVGLLFGVGRHVVAGIVYGKTYLDVVDEKWQKELRNLQNANRLMQPL